MQKKLIALAVAGLASTGAFAQSNVTIYGVADGSFDVVRASGSTVAGNDFGNFNRVSTNSSLIGFKGAESLGNGLTAVFQFEGSVGFDSGSAFGGANRDSYVGVATGLGTVVLGNLTGPTRALGAALDVNAGATSIGANGALLGKLGNNLLNSTTANGDYVVGQTNGKSATNTSIFDTRWKNAIAYVSPSFAGLNLTAAYVANENKTNKASAIAGTQVSTQGYDVGLKYAAGPALAAVTYNAVTLGGGINVAAANQDASVADLRAGASYDFGIASVRGIYDRVKATHLGAAAGTEAKQVVWGVGATFNVIPTGKIIGQFYKANDLKVNGAGAADTGAKQYVLGYEHSLSKRTMLKAVYSTVRNDDNAKYDFGINSVGGVGNGATVSGVSLGLRHTF